jgi:hypothetical protein
VIELGQQFGQWPIDCFGDSTNGRLRWAAGAKAGCEEVYG